MSAPTPQPGAERAPAVTAAVERLAKALAQLEPDEPWPTNAELGGGLTGTRDDEFRDGKRDEARELLAELLVDAAAEPYLVEWATEVDTLGTKEIWDSEAEARLLAERYGQRLFRVEWTEVKA